MIPRPVPMKPATITAVKPTTMETRAPKISRDRMSRPRWSVPSRCSAVPPLCQAGGRKRHARLPTYGTKGASALAKKATKAKRARMRTGTSGKPSSRMKSKRDGRPTASERILMASGLQPDARIDHRIEDVDQQVHQDDH